LEELGELNKEYRRFNTVATQLTVRFKPPSETETTPDPVYHFLASVNDLYEHPLQNVNDSDIAGIAIHSEWNQNDKPIGNSFGRIRYLQM
jgi:hypothetical protein